MFVCVGACACVQLLKYIRYALHFLIRIGASCTFKQNIFAPNSPENHNIFCVAFICNLYANQRFEFIFSTSRSNTYDSIVRHRYLNSVNYEEEEEEIKNKQTKKNKEITLVHQRREKFGSDSLKLIKIEKNRLEHNEIEN